MRLCFLLCARVTLVGCGHNHQYERARIRHLAEPPPGSTLQVPLTQFVFGGAPEGHPDGLSPPEPPEDDPWTGIGPYEDPPGALTDPGLRLVPVDPSQQAAGWLGYAFVIVRPEAAPDKVRVIARNFNFIAGPGPAFLEPAFEETVDLSPR
jgi:hypothetical protein